MCNTYQFSTATILTRSRLNFTLYLRRLLLPSILMIESMWFYKTLVQQSPMIIIIIIFLYLKFIFFIF